LHPSFSNIKVIRMHKILAAAVLIFALGAPGIVQGYSVAPSPPPPSDPTTTDSGLNLDTITTTTRDTDSDVDGLTDSSEPEPDSANPDFLNPDFLNPSADSDYDAEGRLKSDTGPDSTTDKEHKGEIDILSTSDSGTSTSGQYNESDLEFVNRVIGLEGIFVKFGDIQGESGTQAASGTGSSGGNVEFEWKVEEGEALRKPKEIVIVGSKVRGWDSQTKEEIIGAAKDSRDVKTLGDSIAFAAKVLDQNGHFNEIRMDDSSVVLDYEHAIMMFGFWRRTMQSEATIRFGDGEHGRVKVKFPWWHVFGRKTVRPADITSAYDSVAGDDSQLPNLDLETAGEGEDPKENDAYLDTFAWIAQDSRALQTLSDVMKNIHDPGVTLLE